MNSKKLLKIGVLLVAMLMLVAGTSFANTYYVNVQTGLDTKDGLTPGNAKHSISNAIAAAAPGDTISVDWANGNQYLEEVYVDKVLYFTSTNGTPSVTNWRVKIVAASGSGITGNRCTFLGPYFFTGSLEIENGEIYGGGNLLVETQLIRYGVNTSTPTPNYSTVVHGQILFLPYVDFIDSTNGYNMTTGYELPQTAVNAMRNFYTRGSGTVTLNESKIMNAQLITEGVLALGGNTLTINGNYAHTIGGNVTGGSAGGKMIFAMSGGGATVIGNYVMPNIVASGSGSNTLTLNTNAGGIYSILATGGASVNVPSYVGTGSGSGDVINKIGAVTDSSKDGNITLNAARYITSLSNTNTGYILLATAAAIDVSGNVSNSGNGGYISFGNVGCTVNVHGAVTNSNAGYISFAATNDAVTTNQVGDVTQSSSGFIEFDGGATAKSLTNNISSLALGANTRVGANYVGVIRFTRATATITINGNVSNIVTYTGTATYNNAGNTTNWTHTGEISFAATGAALTITGYIDVFATGNYGAVNGGTGSTNAIVSNNGSVIIASVGGNVAINGGIRDRTNWPDVSSHVTSLGNGMVDMSTRTTGHLGESGTRIGAISNTSTTGTTDLVHGNILLGGTPDGVPFYGSSMISTGSHGGQILLGNQTVDMSQSVVNQRTITANHIQFGSAATPGIAVSISGNIQNTDKSTITFPSFQGNGGENFLAGGLISSGASGNILVAGPCTDANGQFRLGSITLSNGTITLGDSASGPTMNVIVSTLYGTGNVSFTGGTFKMGTTVAPCGRLLVLDGYAHKFSSATTRTDFTSERNCQLLVQRVSSFVAAQTLTGDLTETVWPGTLYINNLTGVPDSDAVKFDGGNFRILDSVNFMNGKVSINNMHIFIGGQIPGPTGVGNFINTSSYHTIADGFITMNGNNEVAPGQTVAGVGSFGNFEVDVDSIVTVEPSTGPFTAIFGLTKGRVYGGTDVVFDTLKFTGTWPTIRRNAGTFDSAPSFITMVNVIYIGVDKTSSLELPTAENKLNNLTVATTNGLQTGGAGKGTVQVTVPTYVNGKIIVNPGQALCLFGASLYMRGDSIILNGDITSHMLFDMLILDRPTGTIIKGAGVLPAVQVDTGSVGNMIDGAKGITQFLLGADGWRGGAADNLPGSTGALFIGYVGGTDTAQITVKFGPPDSTTKAHIGYFNGTYGLIVLPHGNLTLAADMIVKGIYQYGTIDVKTYTLTDRFRFSYFSATSVTTGTGVLRFEPEGLVGPPPSVKAPSQEKIAAHKEYAKFITADIATREIPQSAVKSMQSWISKKSPKSPSTSGKALFYESILVGDGGPVTINTNVQVASVPDGTPGLLVQEGIFDHITKVASVPGAIPDPAIPLEGAGNFTITKNLQLDSITTWLISYDFVLTVTGSSVRMAPTTAFLTGGDLLIDSKKPVPTTADALLDDGMLRLNPTVPPLTFACYGDPEIRNLWVSNDVILAGEGLYINNFLHDGGVLDYSADDFSVLDTYIRRDNASYKTVNTWFIFKGITFDQDTTDMTLVNLSFESTGPDSLINRGIVNVSNKLRLASNINYPVDINNTPPVGGATRLAVAALDTVIYIGGRFDVKPTYGGTITLITQLTTSKVIHETVWASNSASLVDTLIIDNVGSGVVSYMPGTRQINNSLELRVGVLSLNGDTLKLLDTLTIRRRQTGSLDLDGGTIPWHWTNVVYEPTAASPDGNISTGPELLSPVNNLTITKYGTPAPGNALITLTRDLVVNGTLRVANNFSMGTHTLELDGHMVVTAPQLTFNGTLIFGGSLPVQTVQLNGTLSPTNVIMQKTAQGLVNVSGGNMDVALMLTFYNGILNITPPSVVIIHKPGGGGQGFDHSGVVYGTCLSHVRGKVRQQVPAGAGNISDGRFEFPVGGLTRTSYRLIAFTFTQNYPVINTTNIEVMNVDTIPEGVKNMPINGGYGIKIRNYPNYFWLVNATPSSFTQTQQFDVELHGTDLVYPDILKDDLRIIRRQDGNALINGWFMQGDSTVYTENYVYRPDPDHYPTDSVVAVRSSSTSGGIVYAGTRFAVGIPARNPEFLSVMRDTTIAQIDSVAWTYSAKSNNIGGSITSYTLVNPPTGAAINSSTGKMVYKPGYSTVPGIYQIVVSANDSSMSKLDTANVAVTKSNRAPSFTATGAAIWTIDSVVERVPQALTYIALDADPGDVVAYSIDTTFGAHINATTGAMTWTPTFAQAGHSYILKVKATDGTATDSTSHSVFVKHSRRKGDTNGSGSISTTDATAILQSIVGIDPGMTTLLDPAAAWAADVSLNSSVSALDASYILQYLVGKRGLPNLPKPIVASGTLSWGNLVSGEVAGTITLPLKVRNASNIYSVEFKANIGSLKVDDLKANLPKDWLIIYKATEGKLAVAAAGVTPISDGNIATICFKVDKDQKPEKVDVDVLMNESTNQTLSVQVAPLPTEFALENNYPNPFNPTTTIKYQLPEDVRVSVTIYNIQGQVVRTLVNEDQKAGYYTIQWDGRSEAGTTVATGIYIYRINAGSFVTAKKMVMMK